MAFERHILALALLVFLAGAAWVVAKVVDLRSGRARLALIGGVVVYAMLSIAVIYSSNSAAPPLRYAGVSTDGWAAPKVQVSLSAPAAKNARVVVHGTIPIDMGLDKQQIAFRANDRTFVEQQLPPGDFGIGAAIDPDIRELTLAFSQEHPLSSEDTRPVAARVKSITIIEATDAPDAIRTFPADLDNPKLEYRGIYADGWLQLRAQATLAARGSADHRIAVRGFIPAGIGLDKQHVTVRANGRMLAEKDLGPGDFAIEAPISNGVQEIVLEFATAQQISKDDRRVAAALLKSMQVE